MADVFGTDISTTNGDWDATQTGDVDTVSGPANLQNALERRWNTRVGALFYAPSYGNPVWDMLSGPYNQDWIDQATIGARNCFLSDTRVADVQVTITPVPAKRQVIFQCQWTAVDGSTGQLQEAVNLV